MTKLIPLTALGQSNPTRGRFGAFTISENTSLSIVSLTFRRSADRHAILQTMDTLAKFQTRPDQWFLVGEYGTSFPNAIKAKAGTQASISDQTDAWVVFEVDGPEDLFEKLCNADMRTLQEGAAVRSVIEYVGCIVVRMSKSFWILGERSMAKSLHHSLVRAAQFAS